MYRIGHSWDTHRLVEGRKLILGGVLIDSKVGLLGHSDADVVYHALSEALLGSLALGDLGEIFPDNSEETLDLDSSIILKHCYELVREKGFILQNCDLMIYSENIKIKPIKSEIRKNISAILGCEEEQISVKATTYEKMGFIGRNEAIACEAVCLVEKK